MKNLAILKIKRGIVSCTIFSCLLYLSAILCFGRDIAKDVRLRQLADFAKNQIHGVESKPSIPLPRYEPESPTAQLGDIWVRTGPLGTIPHGGNYWGQQKINDLYFDSVELIPDSSGETYVVPMHWTADKGPRLNFYRPLESDIRCIYNGKETRLRELPLSVKKAVIDTACYNDVSRMGERRGNYKFMGFSKRSNQCIDSLLSPWDNSLQKHNIQILDRNGNHAQLRDQIKIANTSNPMSWPHVPFLGAGAMGSVFKKVSPPYFSDKTLDAKVKDTVPSSEVGGVLMKMVVSDESYREVRTYDFLEPPGTKRIFMSLGVLAQKVSRCLTSGKPITEECQTLSGIGYLEGYIVQQSNPKDIILFGLASKNRPSLKLDDLVVNMRSITCGSAYPYCSLDPKSENTIALQHLFSTIGSMNSTSEMKAFFKKVQDTVGPQEIVIGGVPRNSRHAHVMIDADYHMKKVSQAHISIDGVTSCIDHFLNQGAEKIKRGVPVPANKASMARFWFHVGKGSPKFQQGTDIVAIDHCNVVILTEKQKATASGELVDVIEDDPHATAFANEMSEYLSVPGSSTVPSYADLENLFRLRALLLSMDFQSLFPSVGWSFSSFIPNYKYLDEKPMGPSMDGLANYKEWTHEVSSGLITYTYSWFPIICGGVGMDMPIDENNYREDLASRLFSFRTAALKARKSKNVLFWTLAVQ